MSKCGAESSPTCRSCPPRKRARKGALYEFARRCQICIYVYHFSPNLLSFKYCHRFSMQFKKHGYSDKDVAAHEGNECDAGTSCIYAATIIELLLHDINNTRREFYQRYVPYVIVNVGTHKENEYDAGAYDYVTGFTWAFWAQYGLSMENPPAQYFYCTSLNKHAA